MAVLGAAVGISFVFGLIIGSFLNVVIHRVPREESIVSPRSRCPKCGTDLRSVDNIPVVSWLVLRGKCRTCAEPISPRYPLVELLTGLLFAATAARIGLAPELPAFLVWVAALVALSMIDLDTFTLPRKIIYVAAGIGAALLAVAAVINGSTRDPREAVLGAVIAFAFLFLIHMISPRGMGFGDVRLAGLLGLFMGWVELGVVAVGLFLAFMFASVVGIGLMAAGRRGRKDRLPFGPFLALGAIVAVWFGVPILDAYLSV